MRDNQAKEESICYKKTSGYFENKTLSVTQTKGLK
jgi:hypothetical protein